MTLNKCEVHSTRPIKVVEGTVTGDYTFTNNTFDMSSEYANSSNTEGRHKNEGIKFESASALGNVLVTGNTISETTYALIAFNTDGKDTDGNGTIDDYEKTGINLATGSTFKVYGNNVGNNKLMVGWDKPNDEFTPSFVDTTDPTA